MEKIYGYEVTENGYFILLNGEKVIHQYEPFIPNKDLSYEENAKTQIKEMQEVDINANKEIEQDKIRIEKLEKQVTDLELALAKIVQGGM